MGDVFVDGSLNYPSCRCTQDCEMPCWQLDGLTEEPCQTCGCDPFVYRSALVKQAPTPAKPAKRVSQSS